MNKNRNYIAILAVCVLMIIDFIPVSAPKSVDNNITMYNASKGFTHPNIYLSNNDIEFIKAKIASNQEPWKSAYNTFITKDVPAAMNTSIQSVTFGGNVPPTGDKHDYYTEPPYLSDGIYDPNADRTDYMSAMKVKDAVRNLGLAYALTGDSKYADNALKIIRAWTIDPVTKMNPKYYNNDQSKVELSITMPGMFYGIDLIWNYPGFSSSDKVALKSWAAQFIQSANSWEGYNNNNNYELWRLVVVSSASVIAEDSVNLQYAFNRWKVVMPLNMDTKGLMIKEYFRTRGMTYSLYGIDALMNTAEIARHNGVDLYNYKTSDGKGIELALDFNAPYASGEAVWPYQEIRWDLVDYGLFELAYSFKQKQSYKDVIINRGGRPMYESRNMGPVTLTHANTYIGIEPGPTTSPTPTSTIGPTTSPTPTSTISTENGLRIYCYKKSKK